MNKIALDSLGNIVILLNDKPFWHIFRYYETAKKMIDQVVLKKAR